MRSSSSSQNADAIRKRMEIVRGEMDENMHEIVDEVRSYCDWRTYVRKSPWFCLSAAFAPGYLMVPKKSPGKPLNPVRTFSTPEILHSSLPNKKTHSTLLTFVRNLALRGISIYLVNQAGRFVAAGVAEPKSRDYKQDSLCKPPEEPKPNGNSSATRFSEHPTFR